MYLNSYDTSDSSKQVETSKETIKGPHLVNRVRYLMDVPTNMDPVLTGVGIIGQGVPWNISGGGHTQSIYHAGESIICSDVITHVLANSSEVTLKSDSFTFEPLKAKTLMVATSIEPFLTSGGDVRLTSVIGASGPDHIRIVVPGMNEDVLSRDDFRSTVRSDVIEADKLDTAVQRYFSDYLLQFAKVPYSIYRTKIAERQC